MIIPFKYNHIEKLKLRASDIEDLKGNITELRNYESYPSWTLVGKMNVYVACFGIVHHEKIKDISASWLIGSTHIEQYKKTLVKEVMKKQNEFKNKTLVTAVIKTHEKSQRWLKFLGYKTVKNTTLSDDKIFFIRKAQ